MENNKARIKGCYIGGLILLTLILLINQCIFTFQRVFAFKFVKNVDIDVHAQIQDQDGNKIDIFLVDRKSDIDFVFIHGSIASGKVFKETLHKMAEETNCNVISYYFRGMNNRRGQPSEKSIIKESVIVGDYIKSRGKKIVVYGQSLGCSVALNMANSLGSSKLILENPFTKYIEIIEKLRFLKWFSYLAVDTWDNVERIKKNKGEILILASEKDQIVPYDNSYKLADVHKNTKVKKLLGSTHFNVLKNENYFKYIKDFIY